jgi:DNA-binding NarL/FixJ family response regulator
MGERYSRRKKKMKVFIADDSRVVVERLASLLEEVPGAHLVGQAGDVPEAVIGIRKMKPDALILDLHMPGGSGLDVLRAIRTDHPDLYVVICTNYPYPEYREQCLTSGANLFLDKSADFEKIPSILRELIQKEAKISPGAR